MSAVLDMAKPVGVDGESDTCLEVSAVKRHFAVERSLLRGVFGRVSSINQRVGVSAAAKITCLISQLMLGDMFFYEFFIAGGKYLQGVVFRILRH